MPSGRGLRPLCRGPLGPIEHQHIADAIHRAGERLTKPWFIRLVRNELRSCRRDYLCTVYFEPDAEMPRYRVGRSLCVGSEISAIEEILAIMNELDASQEREATEPSLNQYIQVSPGDAPFSGVLETPAIPLLPFDSPDHFTEEEVVQIVDFIRSHPKRSERALSENELVLFVDSARPNEPMYSIELCDEFCARMVKDKGTGTLIMVRTGVVEGFLCGTGSFYILEETTRGYRLAWSGIWHH